MREWGFVFAAVIALCICGVILTAPDDLFDRPDFISQSNHNPS